MNLIDPLGLDPVGSIGGIGGPLALGTIGPDPSSVDVFLGAGYGMFGMGSGGAGEVGMVIDPEKPVIAEGLELQDPGNPPPRPWLHSEDDCHYLANTVDEYAKNAWTTIGFVNALRDRFIPLSNQDSPEMREFRSSGFNSEFNDDHGSYNQVRHFVGGFSNAYFGGATAAITPSTVPSKLVLDYAVEEAVKRANLREGPNEHADRALNAVSVSLGVQLGFGKIGRGELGNLIRRLVCGDH